MAKRITRVVTRTGDDGSTGLGDGSRIKKSSDRIECIGEVDELNSLLGLLQAEEPDSGMVQQLQDMQHILFDIGGELAIPDSMRMDAEAVSSVEGLIEEYNRELPPLQEFILPGGSRAAALCHLARAVCRRCERHLFRLSESETVNSHSTTYINRLSDLLFVLARRFARRDGAEIYWRKKS